MSTPNENQTLAQVLAILKPAKAQAEKSKTEIYHDLQKPEKFEGMSKTYQPRTEGEETFPPESKVVQKQVSEVLKALQQTFIEAWDLSATVDRANTEAFADLVVDGQVLIQKAPAVFYLYLEKSLIGLRDVIVALPTLDPAELWIKDENSGLNRTEEKETAKTKKVPVVMVLAPATEAHPAQTQLIHEDKVVGKSVVVRYSGAISERAKRDLLDRVQRIQNAVKFAREAANRVPAPPVHVAAEVMKYIFGAS